MVMGYKIQESQAFQVLSIEWVIYLVLQGMMELVLSCFLLELTG